MKTCNPKSIDSKMLSGLHLFIKICYSAFRLHIHKEQPLILLLPPPFAYNMTETLQLSKELSLRNLPSKPLLKPQHCIQQA